jgi:hypothetical protein
MRIRWLPNGIAGRKGKEWRMLTAAAVLSEKKEGIWRHCSAKGQFRHPRESRRECR